MFEIHLILKCSDFFFERSYFLIPLRSKGIKKILRKELSSLDLQREVRPDDTLDLPSHSLKTMRCLIFQEILETNRWFVLEIRLLKSTNHKVQKSRALTSAIILSSILCCLRYKFRTNFYGLTHDMY